MSIFDQPFDRSQGNARKWAPEVLEGKFNVDPKEAIAMDLADIDFQVAQPIHDAIQKRASIPDYSYTFVSNDFYESVINWNKNRFQLTLEKEWLTLTYGTVSTLHNMVQCYTDVGDSIMFNTPAYDPFLEAVENNNRQPVYSTLKNINNRYELDFEQIVKDIKENQVKLFIFCNPQNPSGRVWTRKELQKLSDICKENKVLLISDEIHREFVFKDSEFVSMGEFLSENDKIILCFSPNKAFNLGGLKTSYVAIKNKKLRDKFSKQLKKNQITSPNVFAIPALVAAYNECGGWLTDMVDYIQENHKLIESFIVKELPLFKVMKPESSFLSWIDVSSVLKTDKEKDAFFQKCNLSIVKGSYFVQDGDNFVRLSIGMPKKQLEVALNRIKFVYDDWLNNNY